MKKQFICKTTLLFLFIIIFFNIKSYAASSDFTYELDSNNYATITAYNGTSGEITIPNTIDGYDVKKIDDHAFDESRNTTNGKILTNVIIEEGITEIGDFAFVDCINLESVTLPESLTKIGWQCFQECSKLNQINIPSNLTSFAPYTFQNTGFREFIIPENINQLNSCVFRSCDQLKTVFVYNADLLYYTTLQSGQIIDYTPFESCSEDLVLYGYLNSTTEAYANDHGFIFKDISTYSTDIEISSISLNKTSVSLNIGKSETIIATILPEDATNKTVTWSSDNENVAKVEGGKITAISEGTATITATSGDGEHKSSCKVTVTKKSITEDKEVKVESIKLDKTIVSLTEGSTLTIAATITPSNATNKTIVWSSDNENIAKVEGGKITAISEGTATITAKTSNGEHIAICKVTVTKVAEDPYEQEKDPTTAPTEIPKAGRSIILISLIIFTIFLAIVLKATLKNYRDIN